jgi:hypothetical protein
MKTKLTFVSIMQAVKIVRVNSFDELEKRIKKGRYGTTYYFKESPLTHITRISDVQDMQNLLNCHRHFNIIVEVGFNDYCGFIAVFRHRRKGYITDMLKKHGTK